jgi:Type VI secretion system, TssN
MNKFFSQEMIRMLGIAGFAGLSLMTFLGVYISRARGSFAPYRKPTIIYLLVATLIAAVVGLMGLDDLFSTPFITLIICQFIFLMLGFLHIRCMRRYLKWSGGDDSFWFEAIFTIVVAAFSLMGFVMVFSLFNREGYQYYLGASVLFFIIAYFIYATFIKAVSIPLKIYAKWFYPVHEEVDDPDEDKLKNMLVISFEFQKKKGDHHYTNFRAKAPADMEFGQLFYYFLNDYNERHPHGKIEFLNEQSSPYGWIFYKKPRWYSFTTRYMDTDKSFFINHIRENDIIVCKRV